MRLTHGLSAVSLLLFGTLASVTASAAPITGNFYLSGSAMGTTSGIQLFLNTPGDTNAIVIKPESGTFNDLTVGSIQHIGNLTFPPVVPGAPFTDPNWIQLTDGIDLDLSSTTAHPVPIPIPSGLSVCPSTGSVSVGFSCLVNATSPVILTQLIDGVSAKLTVYGQAHTGLTGTDFVDFTGAFSAPSTGFSTIAAFQDYYDANHAIPVVGYSADFTMGAAPTTVPEPQTLALIAGGLLVGFGMRKKLGIRKG
jgi:hypothetical protein